MTTIAIVEPATRIRLTVRGRRVLAALAALPAVVVIVLAVLGGGAASATREDGAPADTYSEITVMPGESLWSIAEDVAPSADPRDVVAAIARLNALESGTVSVGQRLAVPSRYGQAP